MCVWSDDTTCSTAPLPRPPPYSHTQHPTPTHTKPQQHMAACASASAAPLVQEFGIPETRLFEFWDWVGGRYSVCASPGALPISLKFGFGVFEKFLAGARAMDRHFLSAPMDRNLPVLMGLLGVWNMSFLGYKCRTIIPYAEALMKFPAHIQQVRPILPCVLVSCWCVWCLVGGSRWHASMSPHDQTTTQPRPPTKSMLTSSILHPTYTKPTPLPPHKKNNNNDDLRWIWSPTAST